MIFNPGDKVISVADDATFRKPLIGVTGVVLNSWKSGMGCMAVHVILPESGGEVVFWDYELNHYHTNLSVEDLL